MQNNMVPSQLRAWLLVAVVPAILSVAGRNGWPAVLLSSIVCGGVCCCVLSCRLEKLPKWLCILELLWLTVFLGTIAKISAGCWVEAKGIAFIPAFLLAFSAWAANKGVHRGARIGATLLWLAVPVLGIVLLSGTADIHLKWISSELKIPDGTLVTLLLFPCATVFLPKERKTLRWSGFALGLVAVVAEVLIQGTMGPEISGNTFYEFSKGITLLGVAERFEALVACALTAGLFVFMVLILDLISHLTEKVIPVFTNWSTWLCALMSFGIMCILPNDDRWMVLGGVIFWGFLPIAAQGIGGKKIIEKK